jgi:geranylgeranyl diphosphate synthase, type II
MFADFKTRLDHLCRLVDEAMDQFLPAAITSPPTIHEAMRYSLFAGGKRLRPVLVLAAAEACGGSQAAALPAACAVECIHTYSLIHDDLPCMDDDDFRRGRLTSHKVYGEAVAVLAGDALQAMAFEILCHAPATPRYTTGDAVRELAQASGSRHLIAGQVMDMEGEGKMLTLEQLRAIHEGKTAALLTACTRLGGMSADAGLDEMDALTQFGRLLGLAFQVIDDILDVTQTSEKLGKTAGKDIATAKATYPALLGLDRSREIAAQLTAEAHAALERFGDRAATLRDIADYLLKREY